MTCFEANMGAVLESYSQGEDNHIPSALSGKTPLDFLAEYDVESHLAIVEALCRHREAHHSTSSRDCMGDDDNASSKRQKVN
eukprot:CAMPEP_0204624918 /NCGR_PEP_ID=MMETSP0717-20131115/10682_1 /ASSEMBLY_ACC=CAM_ASM_000666 /TAXON_ID=230516 /ORGANISM="Chaetoceros curvisetus" /LENGTH=81 /DNA_ID=CAMNT_0051640475 /DNA_START=11 /DNA_END=256 /DNA_ORIENTATION=+